MWRNRLAFTKGIIARQKGDSEAKTPHVIGLCRGLRGDMEAHWDFGNSYAPWEPEHWDILHSVDNPTEAEQDAIFDKLFKDFAQKPVAPCARLGWIAPDGRFFPCAYCAHTDAAEWLVRSQFTSEEQAKMRTGAGGNQEALERAGWLALKGGVIILYDQEGEFWEGTYPDPIMRTVIALYEAFSLASDRGDDIEALVRANPEGYRRQNAWSGADDDGGILRCLELCIEQHASSALVAPRSMDFPEETQVARDPLTNVPKMSAPRQFWTGD